MDEQTWVDRTAFPWEARFVDTGEGRQHYVDVGDGPAVVFVHGTPTWSFEWRHLIRALSKTHRCIAVDHLGFGQSDRPAADYRSEAHARRFARFVEALGLERFTLVVHDFDYRSLWERRAALSSLPALVVWGLADSAFKPSMLERWKEALPRAQVLTIEGAGHWPHEEAPVAFVESLQDFLGSLEAASA